jgi:1-acyl-sn-glycerol-3-phosphate acyltransferase
MPPFQTARSLLFHIALYLNTIIMMIVCSPFLLLPRKWLWKPVAVWSAINLWLLRALCGTKSEIRGLERLPKGGYLVAGKHQSAWEAMAVLVLFEDPAFVYKRELAWIPLFGWYILKAELIPVHRGTGLQAIASVARRARQEIARGRQVAMFPEGTRRAPGAPPSYKYGTVHLYRELNVPCVPIALNSGVFWPRRSLAMRPGTIVAEILEPIPPGLPDKEFAARMQDAIESATARLVAEGYAELEAAGIAVAERSSGHSAARTAGPRTRNP